MHIKISSKLPLLSFKTNGMEKYASISSVGFFKCKKCDPKYQKMTKIGTLEGHYTKSISRNSIPKYSKFAHSSKVYFL